MVDVDEALPTAQVFDFDEHRRAAVESYQHLRRLYEDFAETLHSILRQSILSANLKIASIEWRAKDIESFGIKSSLPSSSDPEIPKDRNPLLEITDLAAVRIITFFPRTVNQIDTMLREQFNVIEVSNKGDILRQEEKLGYQSVHYLVTLKPQRSSLPEYSRFSNLVAEIQVRTILQHAWAEIEHDIQYKSAENIPGGVKRRFTSLAGLLEIADREFQAIQEEDERLRQEARTSIQENRLETVEITPDALKQYLDRKLGPDGRMATWSYEWMSRMLRRMGFRNFSQIDECISGLDDNSISRKFWGRRQGQLERFELLLVVGMGEKYVELHPFTQLGVPPEQRMWRLDRLRKTGVEIREYCPPLVDE